MQRSFSSCTNCNYPFLVSNSTLNISSWLSGNIISTSTQNIAKAHFTGTKSFSRFRSAVAVYAFTTSIKLFPVIIRVGNIALIFTSVMFVFTFANQTDLTALAASVIVATSQLTVEPSRTFTSGPHSVPRILIGFVGRTISEQTSLYKHAALRCFGLGGDERQRYVSSAGREATGQKEIMFSRGAHRLLHPSINENGRM